MILNHQLLLSTYWKTKIKLVVVQKKEKPQFTMGSIKKEGTISQELSQKQCRDYDLAGRLKSTKKRTKSALISGFATFHSLITFISHYFLLQYSHFCPDLLLCVCNLSEFKVKAIRPFQENGHPLISVLFLPPN